MKKHNCEICNYSTGKLSDYKKHLLTMKHKDNIEKTSPNKGDLILIKGEIRPKKGENCPKKGFDCIYCKQYFKDKSHKARHLKLCKDKYNTELKEKELEQQLEKERLEKIEIEKKNEEIKKKNADLEMKVTELNNKLLKYLEEDRGKVNNQTIINIQNTERLDSRYVEKYCTEAYDYKQVMGAKLTNIKIDNLQTKSHINGPYDFLYDRCIKNIPFEKRCIHLTDESRSRYLVKLDGHWIVDKKGEAILSELISKVQPVYIINTEGIDINTILKNSKKFHDFYKDRHKVLSYLNEEILLKNNEKLLKKAISLLSSTNDNGCPKMIINDKVE